MMKKNFLKNVGITFVEVIIAMAIMALVTLGSIAYTKFTLGRTMDVRYYDYAVRLAGDAADTFKSQPYTFSAPTVVSPKFGINFNVGYSASEPAGLPGRFKIVIVTVTWNADGAQHEMNLWSRISPED